MCNAASPRIAPPPPRVPHDWLELLSYEAPQRLRHVRRCAESAARAAGIELDGSTLVDG